MMIENRTENRCVTKTIKKMLVWYLLLNKRLLKKAGFLVILSLIPVLAFMMTCLTSSSDSGLIRVAVCSQDAQILSSFKEDPSDVFHYSFCEDEEEALRLLTTSKVESAWVFAEDLEGAIERYADGNPATLVRIYEPQSSSLLKLSHEKIFSVLYPRISYRMYSSYIDELGGKEDFISEEEKKEIFEQFKNDGTLMRYEYLNASKESVGEINYLTTPMGGMFAVLMLLCGLASTMYFLDDEKKGIFNWLLPKNRALVLWTSNFCAVTVAAVFSTVALILSNNYTSITNETVFMLIYILASASFCTLIGVLIPSQRAFGIVIPILLVACLVFCPIFLDLKDFRAIQMILPPSYFLFGRFDSSYIPDFVIYTILVSIPAFGLYIFKHRRGN